MIKGVQFGHAMKSDYKKVDFIVPKNIDENEIISVSTIWNKKEKKGETMVMNIPNKSYWKLIDNPPRVINTHTNKKEALKFHDKIKGELNG